MPSSEASVLSVQLQIKQRSTTNGGITRQLNNSLASPQGLKTKSDSPQFLFTL